MAAVQTSAGARRHGNVLHRAVQLVKNNRRAYLLANLLYYATVVVGVLVVFISPSLQDSWMATVVEGFGESDTFGAVLEAYSGKQVLAAVGLTFAVNLILGSFLYITLPSLIIPFSGLLLALVRALLWGFTFAPSPNMSISAENVLFGSLMLVLLLLEGQAYILAMLGAYLQSRAFVFHGRVAERTLWRGYVHGLKQAALVYVLVVLVLLVAAVYEVAIVVLT